MAPKKLSPAKTFDSAMAYFRVHDFSLQEMPGAAGQMQIRKRNCGAIIARRDDSGVNFVVRPGCVVGGEIATLIDRGYQKFLVTKKMEIAATAARLQELHAFQEEVWEATGRLDYYNLALGTISDLYWYDRLEGREPETQSTAESHQPT